MLSLQVIPVTRPVSTMPVPPPARTTAASTFPPQHQQLCQVTICIFHSPLTVIPTYLKDYNIHSLETSTPPSQEQGISVRYSALDQTESDPFKLATDLSQCVTCGGHITVNTIFKLRIATLPIVNLTSSEQWSEGGVPAVPQLCQLQQDERDQAQHRGHRQEPALRQDQGLQLRDREQEDGDDLRQLPDQHHHPLEEERPG